MPPDVQKGLSLIGVGLLIGFMGLVWVANLFGVADEHARLISENRNNRRMSGDEGSPAEFRNSPRFKRAFRLGRYAPVAGS